MCYGGLKNRELQDKKIRIFFVTHQGSVVVFVKTIGYTREPSYLFRLILFETGAMGEIEKVESEA